MRILWSIPVRGEGLGSPRGDLVRAARLIGGLRRLGHEVRVVEDVSRRSSRWVVGSYRQVARRLLPRFPGLVLRDLGRWVYGLGHARRVASAALEHGAEVVVETQVHGTVAGALVRRRTGLPLVLDDCSPVSEEIALGVGLPALVSKLFGRQLMAASRIVVPTRVLAELLGPAVPAADSVCVIPNGVDLRAHELADRAAARARLGLGGQCVVGFVGSFQPWHRVELLVEAVGLLGTERALHLMLIGDGAGRPTALARAEELGLADRLSALAAVPPNELPELVAALDIGVVPGSNRYGQPMKLLEYSAAGIPSVAPDLEAVRETFDDGSTALLFAADRADALAEALALLVDDEDLRRRLGAAAQVQVAAGASWDLRAERLARLIQEAR